jgi:O-acetyl-ADP-ribose deacetylase (regulator of RNase III)
MVAAWRAENLAVWDYFSSVRVLQNDFQTLDLKSTCVVSPSNSFGLFTGGVDYYIAKTAFPEDPPALTRLAQKEIADKFGGQVPVGACHVMPVNERLPFLGICPTMRTPASALAPDSTIPYDCTFSAITAVARYNSEHGDGHSPIESVVMFGFGTGIGGLSVEHCARMMALAAKHCAMLKSLPTEVWNSRGFSVTHNTVSKVGREIAMNARGHR